MTIANKQSTAATDLTAHAMPFARIISSGTFPTNLAVRATRVRRKSLKIRNSVEVLPLGVSEEPDNLKYNTKIQVSHTIDATRHTSNINHPSLRASDLSLKAITRTTISNTKKVQKQFSTTWNKAGA
jgi:hypothetical protein